MSTEVMDDDLWARLRSAIPTGKSPGDNIRRQKLFVKFDTEHRGKLTLDDVLVGCFNVLGLGRLCNKVSLVVDRAFSAATASKAAAAEEHGLHSGEDAPPHPERTVDFSEFRLLLMHLYNFFELYCMFAAIDQSGLQRIDVEQFTAAVPLFEQWGMRKIDDPQKVYAEMDDNNSGYVSFDEFVVFAASNRLDLDGACDNLDIVVEEEAAKEHGNAAEVPIAVLLKETPVRKAWAAVSKGFPLAAAEGGKAARRALFQSIGWSVTTGTVSATELHFTLCKSLKLTRVAGSNTIMQVIRRAVEHVKHKGLGRPFAASYNPKTGGGGGTTELEIDGSEFLHLLHVMYVHLECFSLVHMLESVMDGRLDEGNFRHVGFLTLLQTALGIPAFGDLKARAVFGEIDDTKAGFILYDELADWVLTKMPLPEKELDCLTVRPGDDAGSGAQTQAQQQQQQPSAAADRNIATGSSGGPVAAAVSDLIDPRDDEFYIPREGREDYDAHATQLQLADRSATAVGFIDATLTQVIAASPLLPKLSGQIMSPLRRRPQRVVPLLINELHSLIQAQQRITLKLLLTNLDDFIAYDDTTANEWEAMLVTLFAFTYRRGGLTPMQSRHNDDSSDYAFLILHKFFGNPGKSAKFPQLLQALQTVMAHLKCTRDDALHRAAPTKLPPRAMLEVQDLYVEEDKALARQESDASVVLLERSHVSAYAAALQQAPALPLQIHPFFFTVDCVPEAERFGFCEKDYAAFETFFLTLNPNGGKDSSSLPPDESVDLLTAEWPIINAATGDVATSKVIGRFYIADTTVYGWRRDLKDGRISLTKLIRTFFPYVCERTLLRRVHGVVMVDDFANAAQALGPTPSVSQVVAPTALQRANTKLVVLQHSQAGATEAHALAIAEWFDALDYLCSGKVMVEQLVRPEGNLQLGDHVLEPSELGASKGPSGPFTLADVCRVVFTTEFPRTLDALVTKAVSARRDADVLLSVEKSKLDRKFQAQLLAHTKAVAKEQEDDEASNPAGNIKTKLTAVQRATLRVDVFAVMDREFNAYELASSRVAEKVAQRAALRAKRQDVIQRQRDSLHDFRATEVPTMMGAAEPPVTVEYHGLAVNQQIFVLDFFAAQASTRARVVEVLQTLDAAGVFAGWFLSDHTVVHQLLGRPLLTAASFVYRDFAFCGPRPPLGGFWAGNHTLHIHTSIRQHSNVKYRFALEGYNFGVNKPVHTVVVGFAAKGMLRANAFEAYGWPDGWDQHTALHKGGGIESLQQYFASDGCLTFECTARSFSKVGFGISAWLVCAEYGADHQVTATVVHQEKRL